MFLTLWEATLLIFKKGKRKGEGGEGGEKMGAEEEVEVKKTRGREQSASGPSTHLSRAHSLNLTFTLPTFQKF